MAMKARFPLTSRAPAMETLCSISVLEKRCQVVVRLLMAEKAVVLETSKLHLK